jgi:hypothetical protein
MLRMAFEMFWTLSVQYLAVRLVQEPEPIWLLGGIEKGEARQSWKGMIRRSFDLGIVCLPTTNHHQHSDILSDLPR